MNQDGLRVIRERFGRDTVIVLGTTNGDYPAIRHVNAYYEDGAFYVITYALSNKMKQIEKNPKVSLCAEWFTARGRAINLGYFGKEENAEPLRIPFLFLPVMSFMNGLMGIGIRRTRDITMQRSLFQ